MKKSFKKVMIDIVKQDFLITLPVFEFLWFITLFFMENDHIGGLQIVTGILGIVVAIIVFILANKMRPLWKKVMYVVIIIIFLIINVGWSLGIARQNSEVTNPGTVEEVRSGASDNGGIKSVQGKLKSLVLQNDYFLKSLTEYTNEQGSDTAKITALFESEIADWMKDWNSLSLGEFGYEYMERREMIDEIYNICCLGEVESKHIKKWAIDDFKLCIAEIDSLNDDYPNPELLKEEAGKYIELGDLYVSLGEQSGASDCYLAAIKTAWEGVEESVKYGMSKNAVETLETMSKAYQRVKKVSDKFDEWDRKRASIIGDALNELTVSFDDRFFHD